MEIPDSAIILWKVCLLESYYLDVSSLTSEQLSIQESAIEFSKQKFAPFVAEWEKKHHFPVDVIKEAAQYGFASIYNDPEYGGCGLGRFEASLIFEALATSSVPLSAYLSIHNMNAWLLDTYGSKEHKEKYGEMLATMEVWIFF